MRKKIILVIINLVLIAILVGVMVWRSQDYPGGKRHFKDPEPIKIELSYSNWQTLEKSGYSITYPPEFSVQDDGIIADYDMARPDRYENNPDLIRIEIRYVEPCSPNWGTTGEDADSWLAAISSKTNFLEGQTFYSRVRSGVATYGIVDINHPDCCYYIDVSGSGYSKHQDLIEEIVGSFKMDKIDFEALKAARANYLRRD